ncbi:MAG: DUF1003 domain-containing protein [Candidatus Vogelbacteria bacterium]|nr:DUF1003 domain-containing protein [Candidatus Vogelbacteria bacterium]
MTKEKKPLSLAELKALRKPVRNVNKEWRDHLSHSEAVALWFTEHIGSMGFFVLILVFNALWMLWNAFAPASLIFDSAWEFLVLLFINNILQILFLPLVMVGQNLQNRHTEVRVEQEYDLSLKSEREIEVILENLEDQNKVLRRLEKALEEKRKPVILTATEGEEMPERSDSVAE